MLYYATINGGLFVAMYAINVCMDLLILKSIIHSFTILFLIAPILFGENTIFLGQKFLSFHCIKFCFRISATNMWGSLKIMCFVFIWEQTATCATYSINCLVFITQMKSVYSAVRTGSSNKAVCASSVKG